MGYDYLKQLALNFHSNKNQILYLLTGIKLLDDADLYNIEKLSVNDFYLFLLHLATKCEFDILGRINFKYCSDSDLCIFCMICRNNRCGKCPYYKNYGGYCWDEAPYGEIIEKLKEDRVIKFNEGFSDIPEIQELIKELLTKFAKFQKETKNESK